MPRRKANPGATPAPPPASGESRVPVVIRAGHTHRDVRYDADTPYQATPEEANLLRRFGGLAGDT